MPKFSRGYNTSRERINKYPYYSRSCFNCDLYYKSKGDLTELCQNPEVLQYDMVVEEDRVYCLQWRLNTTKHSQEKTKRKSLFKQ